MINNQLLSLLRNIILHSIFSRTNAVSLNKFPTETPTEGKINIYIDTRPQTITATATATTTRTANKQTNKEEEQEQARADI